jgi:hypothetical protein
MTALAAKKWHVPFWLLWGVKVIETGPTGTGIGQVSSAGAEGPFQFIPETAAAYHVNVGSFQSSANGAAHYLHDLKKQYGSWNEALAHYSGGGYGLQSVKEGANTGGVKVGSSGKAVLADIKTPLGTIPTFGIGPEINIDPLSGLPSVPSPDEIPGKIGSAITGGGGLFAFPGEIIESFQQFTKIAELLTSPKFWIRVGEATGGIILLYMALKALTGTSVSDVPGVKTGTKIGKDAAAAAAFKRLPPAQRVK